MTFIFTALFSVRFRLSIHDRFTEESERGYTIQVKNAVVLEEKNR